MASRAGQTGSGIGAAMACATLLAAGAVLIGVAQGGWSQMGAVLAARYTARLSFYWFIAAWSASSLARLWPGGWRGRLLARRRAVGLGFAAAHAVHLIALVMAIMWFGRASSAVQIIGGGLAYLFVLAMAVTSNNAAIRLLGVKNWRRLHVTGGWILFVAFAQSYVKSLTIKPFGAVPGLLLLLAALGLRIAVMLRRTARHADRPAAA